MKSINVLLSFTNLVTVNLGGCLNSAWSTVAYIGVFSTFISLYLNQCLHLKGNLSSFGSEKLLYITQWENKCFSYLNQIIEKLKALQHSQSNPVLPRSYYKSKFTWFIMGELCCCLTAIKKEPCSFLKAETIFVFL